MTSHLDLLDVLHEFFPDWEVKAHGFDEQQRLRYTAENDPWTVSLYSALVDGNVKYDVYMDGPSDHGTNVNCHHESGSDLLRLLQTVQVGIPSWFLPLNFPTVTPEQVVQALQKQPELLYGVRAILAPLKIAGRWETRGDRYIRQITDRDGDEAVVVSVKHTAPMANFDWWMDSEFRDEDDSITGCSGTLSTRLEAMDAADAFLRVRGWILIDLPRRTP